MLIRVMARACLKQAILPEELLPRAAQLQEEQAFHGTEYEMIGIHENLLFGYQEFPAGVEEPVLPGKLATSGTPEEWTDSRMDLHFQPWPDGHLYFKPAETLFALQAPPRA